ncbi:hypothetical protein VE25_19060 [Devosia geojensis]|uniref:Uncharacterized protein n=1 Tax=Devosia geojensis TaxID=443610 RepID=A0A0F5FEC5_9HYPH|nr:hypothetical protein [Devosia geojensis]KKB07138.1 hypothetical protein VE25_19060 [Devosia geojensis]
MSMFAVVHRPADLARACEDISAFLAFHHRKRAASRAEPLIGIWLDPGMAAEMVAELNEKAPKTAAGFGKVRESVSLGGVWTLCWLDSERVVRLPLLETLLEQSIADAENAARRRFIPVFLDDLPVSEVQSEMHELRRHRPSCVMPSLWQEGETGRISLPSDYLETATHPRK